MTDLELKLALARLSVMADLFDNVDAGVVSAQHLPVALFSGWCRELEATLRSDYGPS